MKFPTDRPVKVVMLGAGGTGGYVAPYVFRLLHMLDRPARFVVCDGDILMQVHQKFLFVRCIRRIRNVQTYFLKKIVILKK